MARPRHIIHINIPYFVTAVELLREPSLRQRPVVVAMSQAHALIMACNNAAYEAGVCRGMSVEQARKVCRDVVCVAHHETLQKEVARTVYRQAQSFVPVVELADTNGHLFLDATGCRRLCGAPEDIAQSVCRRIQEDCGVVAAWGIAANKLVAKVAMRSAKLYDSRTVARGEERRFLEPLALALLPGVSHDDRRALSDFHIHTIGQAAQLSLAQLTVLVGRRAPVLYEALQGRDISLLRSGDKEDDMVFRHAFPEPLNDALLLEQALFTLAVRVGRMVRSRKMLLCRIALCVVYRDGVRSTRQVADRRGCCYDPDIFHLLQKALRLAWKRSVGVVGFVACVGKAVHAVPRISLFAAEARRNRKKKQLFIAYDKVRKRWGADSLVLGKSLQARR